MSTEVTTTGSGPDVVVDGHPLKNRQHGALLIANVHDATVTAGPGGTPVTDWSHLADRVDATDLAVGDFVNVGAGMFAEVTTGPRKWRNFTRVVSTERTHDFRQGAQAWRLRKGA